MRSAKRSTRYVPRISRFPPRVGPTGRRATVLCLVLSQLPGGSVTFADDFLLAMHHRARCSPSCRHRGAGHRGRWVSVGARRGADRGVLDQCPDDSQRGSQGTKSHTTLIGSYYAPRGSASRRRIHTPCAFCTRRIERGVRHTSPSRCASNSSASSQVRWQHVE